MIITIKQFSDVTTKHTTQEAVAIACDGADYERGQLEAMEKSLQYTQDILARVLEGMNHDIVKRALEASGKLEVMEIE